MRIGGFMLSTEMVRSNITILESLYNKFLQDMLCDLSTHMKSSKVKLLPFYVQNFPIIYPFSSHTEYKQKNRGDVLLSYSH